MFGGRRRDEREDLRTFIEEGFRRDERERRDLRIFVRETLLRYDRGIAAMREENRINAEAIRKHQEDDRKRLDEILAEGRAGREALFRILDRMDGNGGAAPAS
jgi:hypothetical protein